MNPSYKFEDELIQSTDIFNFEEIGEMNANLKKKSNEMNAISDRIQYFMNAAHKRVNRYNHNNEIIDNEMHLMNRKKDENRNKASRLNDIIEISEKNRLNCMKPPKPAGPNSDYPKMPKKSDRETSKRTNSMNKIQHLSGYQTPTPIRPKSEAINPSPLNGLSQYTLKSPIFERDNSNCQRTNLCPKEPIQESTVFFNRLYPVQRASESNTSRSKHKTKRNSSQTRPETIIQTQKSHPSLNSNDSPLHAHIPLDPTVRSSSSRKSYSTNKSESFRSTFLDNAQKDIANNIIFKNALQHVYEAIHNNDQFD